ncbi:RNA helicase [Gnomoniopsis sp. IMI 355080]|nr:RNA helicase [Gnomoniopsis sp. IMI 355080]
MKCLWNSARALERRSHVLSPVIFAASVPGTRRGRKVSAHRKPSQRFNQGLDHNALRDGLEAQAQEQGQDARSNRFKADSSIRKSNSDRYRLFKKVVESRFELLLREGNFRDLRHLGINTPRDLAKEAHLFKNIIEKAFDLAARSGTTTRQKNPYFWSWRHAFITGDIKALVTELQYSFVSFVVRQHLSKDAIACHERLADMRFPHEWFPATRTMQRTIHLHVGPTNSGKTYNALKALENSKTGIYAGPLRLLAHETFTRLKAKGRRCALITGEEQRIPEGDDPFFASCTVEMTPLNQRVDVAIIDEIQMIGDEQRGWAWTQAVLGVQAKELHLCGEERAVPLIEELCSKTGDEVVVHQYKRLSSLQPMQESLHGKLENLRKGDAVVSFSRFNLHSLKAGIEQTTGKKCAIVYGALPPESRAQQAALFNDPDNDYDFLAASDAIGMGLNLEIKRVVFEAVNKHDGVKVRQLSLPELKQIGGRAGRYRTAAQANRSAASNTDSVSQPSAGGLTQKEAQVGFVTTLEEEDLDVVHESFDQEAEPLQTAGLFPPSSIIEKFASYFPAGTPFSFMLLRLRDIARLPGRFHMCDLRSNLEIAQVIQQYPLTIHDRCVFINAPCALRDFGMPQIIRALAKRIAYHKSGNLLDIPEFNLEVLDYSLDNYPQGREQYLKHLEALHKSLVLYLWLSYRYTGIFLSQALAFHVKEMVETKINEHLHSLNYSAEARRQRIADNRRAVRKAQHKTDKILDEVEDRQSTQAPVAWTEEGQEDALQNGLGIEADNLLSQNANASG